MVSTIRTERGGRDRVRRLVAAAIGLLVGGALVVVSAPIVIGAAAALPGDAAARCLRQRTMLDEEQRLALISSRTRAIGHYAVLDWRRELATASVMPRGDQPVEAQAIERSRIQTIEALELGPASPQDWLRLSMLEAMQGERLAAVRHLSTALLTGADMPRLRWRVLDVGFGLWRDLPVETRVSTLLALRNTWRGANDGQRLALLRGMRERGFLPLTRLALAEEEGLQEVLGKL